MMPMPITVSVLSAGFGGGRRGGRQRARDNRRHADDDGVGRHVPGDDGARADQRAFADRHASHNRGVAADRGAALDEGWLALPLTISFRQTFVVGGARKLWRFNLQADGTVDFETRKLIHDWKTTRGPDGIKLDSAGRLFVAAGLNRQNAPYETQDKPTAGVYVFSPTGELLEFIAISRDETTNCAFGGDDLKTLFVTAGGLWSFRVSTPGKPVWPVLP